MNTKIYHVGFEHGDRALCGKVVFGYDASNMERLPSMFYPPLTTALVNEAQEKTNCQDCHEILRREVRDRG